MLCNLFSRKSKSTFGTSSQMENPQFTVMLSKGDKTRAFGGNLTEDNFDVSYKNLNVDIIGTLITAQ